MFLLTSAWFPTTLASNDFGPYDMATYGAPKLFHTKEAALAHAEQRVEDEWNKPNTNTDPEFDASQRLRLVDESYEESVGSDTTTWVFGTEDSSPEHDDYEGFVFFYLEPIAFSD